MPLIDLLLQKLQIVDLTAKGAVDVVVLLAGHELGGAGQPQTIDVRHLVELLSDDWGFYYTAIGNLARIREFASSSALDEGRRTAVAERIDRLAAEIESEPKTRRWRMRAKVGTRKKCYRDVEEDVEAF